MTTFEYFDYLRLVWVRHYIAGQLFFLHGIVKLLCTLLNFLHKISFFLNDSQIIIFVPLLLELSVLVFEILDFFFEGSDHHVFFVELLFEENVVDFVSLLDNNQIIIGMGQLTNIVFQLHKFFLHIFLILGHVFLALFSFFFFLFVLIK